MFTKVKHEKAEEAPVETEVPGTTESPATPPAAEPAFEAQEAPAEVAEQAAASPEPPVHEEDRTTGAADDGETLVTPEVAAPDAITEAGPDVSTTETAPPAATEAPAKERISNLDVPALQARFRELTGRESTSTEQGHAARGAWWRGF